MSAKRGHCFQRRLAGSVWQDAAHESFGVVTASLYTHAVKIEGSAFNGREPDPYRFNFDYQGAKLDSYSGRLTELPNSRVSVAAWGTDEPYVRYYLDGLLDEMVALRKELFRHSIHGTIEEVNQEVLRNEKRMKDLAEKLRVASSQNVPQGKLSGNCPDRPQAGHHATILAVKGRNKS